MLCIRGKTVYDMDAATLAATAGRYLRVHIDIGTGDGRYVTRTAHACPGDLAIGIDAYAAGMRGASRRAPANALYLIANALALPEELTGLGTHLTVNFPWGSLLTGLLDGDPALLDGLQRLARPGASLEVLLNGGALAEAGWNLQDGAAQVRHMLREVGLDAGRPALLDAKGLGACPTTWAKRLAYGRDPRAVRLRASFKAGTFVPRLLPDASTVPEPVA